MIEACISTAAEAEAAQRAGAGRLELCAALELGGLTPTTGTLRTVLDYVDLPVMVMLRPRAGGFAYDRREWTTICRDAESLLEQGARGIVFGTLTIDGRIDRGRVQELVELAGAHQTVFHRAFDYLQSPTSALETLIEAGVSRVLTSGLAATALEGIPTLRQLHTQAAGRIEILPAGGIRAANVHEICTQTGCPDAHVGASDVTTDGSIDHQPELNLVDPRCGTQHRYRRLNSQALTEAVETHQSTERVEAK